MGIHLGWNQCADIPANAWARVCADFQKLEGPYQAEIVARRARQRAKLPMLAALFQAMPKPAFEVARVTDEVLEVLPSLAMRTWGQPAWRLERVAGENWFKQGLLGDEGAYQGEMLLAALLLVERHAPGTVQITQDDYGRGCWAQAASWMDPIVGGGLRAPQGAGGVDDPGADEDGQPIPGSSTSKPGL